MDSAASTSIGAGSRRLPGILARQIQELPMLNLARFAHLVHAELKRERLMRPGFFTFLCGLSCGLTIAVAHDRRWGSAVFDLIVSGLPPFNAWNNWRIVQRRGAGGPSFVQGARQALKSSQSHVAKMEAGDPTFSIDLLIKSILALGGPNKDLAAIIGLRQAFRATESPKAQPSSAVDKATTEALSPSPPAVSESRRTVRTPAIWRRWRSHNRSHPLRQLKNEYRSDRGRNRQQALRGPRDEIDLVGHVHSPLIESI